MALKCRIEGKRINAPIGNESKLFNKLEQRFGFDRAMNYYALTENEDYLPQQTDENGEMLENDFLRYIFSEDTAQDFSSQDLDFSLAAVDTSKLESIYKGGIFQPTLENLMSTGIFTRDEAKYISGDEQVQQNLKEYVENAEKRATQTIEGIYAKSDTYNSLGFRPLEDITDKIYNYLSSATTSEEAYNKVENIPYNILNVDNAYLRELAMNLHNVAEVKDMTQVRETLENTLDVSNLEEVGASAQRLGVYTDKALLIEEYDNLVNSLSSAGYEIPITKEQILNKDEAWFRELSQNVTAFTSNMDSESLESLSQFISENTASTRKTINLKTGNDPKTLRYLDTTQSEVATFKEHGVIKHSDTIYQKVNPSYTKQQITEAIYNKVAAGGITLNYSEIADIENLEEFSDEINREVSMESLDSYIDELTSTLEDTETLTAQKIIAFKMFYGAPLENRVSEKQVSTSKENEQYLREDFTSDFNKERLRQKELNSESYNNFYKYLKVDHKGIRPIDDAAITLEKIKNKASQELVDYFNLSKFADVLIQEETDTTISNFERLRAVQNTEVLPQLKAYQKVSETEVVGENMGDFVKIKTRPYEKVLERGDKVMYKLLNKTGGTLNQTNVLRPITDKKPRFLEGFLTRNENNITNSRNLSQKEVEDKFKCT